MQVPVLSLHIQCKKHFDCSRLLHTQGHHRTLGEQAHGGAGRFPDTLAVLQGLGWGGGRPTFVPILHVEHIGRGIFLEAQ